MLMFDEYKKLIEEANQRVYEVAKRTDLDYAPQLSARHNNKIWLKREDQQSVFNLDLKSSTPASSNGLGKKFFIIFIS